MYIYDQNLFPVKKIRVYDLLNVENTEKKNICI